jgi:hypothetical protein
MVADQDLRAPEPEWVATLRAAARGGGSVGVEVLRLEAGGPSGASLRALVSLMIAGLLVAAAVLRARVAAGAGFDLLGSLLRTTAVAFAVRATLHVLLAAGDALRRLRRGRGVLCLGEAGLFEQSAAGERWLAREDALAVVVRESAGRGLGQPERPVFVVARPRREVAYLELDPRYAGSPEVLGARLSRWLGEPDGGEAAHAPPREESVEERYARAARGQADPGDVVVPEGAGYRLRAPYAGLLGIVFAIDALLHAGTLRPRIVPVVLLSCVLAVVLIAGWLVWMRQRGATRLGIAMLFTPEELIVRGPGGALGVPWGQVSSAAVHTRLGWSPFFGSFATRSLTLGDPSGTHLTFDAGFLGVPPEVLAALIEAYRAGRV